MYTFGMKNVIALICLAPAYSLARFIGIQTNGALWLGRGRVDGSCRTCGWPILGGSKDTYDEGNAVFSFEFFAQEARFYEPFPLAF
jgi:hypothetical protein